MPEFLSEFINEYGLLPPYAVIIALVGLSVSSFGQLIAAQAILCGAYIVILKLFDMRIEFGVLDFSHHLNVTRDQGNMLIAVLFVFFVGFVAFNLKRLVKS